MMRDLTWNLSLKKEIIDWIDQDWKVLKDIIAEIFGNNKSNEPIGS